VYGRLPKKLPKVTWSVAVTGHERVGRIPVVAKQLVGHVDNSEYPLIDVNISMALVVPEKARGPVPVLMMFGRAALPAPAQPPLEDLEKINAKLRALLGRGDPEMRAILERYPAYSPIASAPMGSVQQRWACGSGGGSSVDGTTAGGRMGLRSHQSR
jgi:hypothetical protein